jgi:hypothetical protein
MTEQLTLQDVSPLIEGAPPRIQPSGISLIDKRKLAPRLAIAALLVTTVAGAVVAYARISSLTDELGQAQQSLTSTQESLASETRRGDQATLLATQANRDLAEAESRANDLAGQAEVSANSARSCIVWIRGFQSYMNDYSAVFDVWGEAIKGNWTYTRFGSEANAALTKTLDRDHPTITDAQKSACLASEPGSTSGS